MNLKYNVGDRVMAVPYKQKSEAVPATVIWTADRIGYMWNYGLSFDDDVRGHDLNGRCPDGHGFWLNEDSIVGYEEHLPDFIASDISQFFGGD